MQVPNILIKRHSYLRNQLLKAADSTLSYLEKLELPACKTNERWKRDQAAAIQRLFDNVQAIENAEKGRR